MKAYDFLLEENERQEVISFEGSLHEAAQKAVQFARREAKKRSARIVVSIKSLVNHQIAEFNFAKHAA